MDTVLPGRGADSRTLKAGSQREAFTPLLISPLLTVGKKRKQSKESLLDYG